MKDFLVKTLKDKRILITGHTGFKGSWLCLLLREIGADIYGYALEPPTNPSLYEIAGVKKFVKSFIGDIRDNELLLQVLQEIKPEIIIHMAAQPLVGDSYKNPLYTYDVNVMGTVKLLEAVRKTQGVKAIVNVTTDKCYENKEWHWGYRENEPLGGFDPYSNSKGCSELVTIAYRNSFFNPTDYDSHGTAIATARAGNVIGGGDWAENRLVPDFFRSICAGNKIRIRNPFAIRPWQHVLEPLTGYLILAAKLFTNGIGFAEAWNFGPYEQNCKNVKWIISTLCELWGGEASFVIDTNPFPHEATYLKLDSSKAKERLGWEQHLDITRSLKSIVDWNKSYLAGINVHNFTKTQIEEYLKII